VRKRGGVCHRLLREVATRWAHGKSTLTEVLDDMMDGTLAQFEWPGTGPGENTGMRVRTGDAPGATRCDAAWPHSDAGRGGLPPVCLDCGYWRVEPT
jgi:hypothetical protein